MAKQVTRDGASERPEELLLRSTQPLPALPLTRRPAEATAPALRAWRAPRRTRSYRPTGWALADHLLDIVDELTHGRAEWCQRVFSYLAIGGFAAVVNLIVFKIVLDAAALPVSYGAHYMVAELVAAEVSILANFIPNDYFTFSHLSGHSRSWQARCLRFHITAIAGTLVTIAVSFTLNHLGLSPLVAQVIAILIALIFNFTFHHVFTYRQVAQPA